jgi:all-trans-retinol 13,14-reductase
MSLGNRYKSEMTNENWDAIIIGSGISGLTAGRLLSDAGQKVLILEKHFKFGGYTHTFKRNNYEWDVGIHYIGGNLHKRNSFIRRLSELNNIVVSDGNIQSNNSFRFWPVFQP